MIIELALLILMNAERVKPLELDATLSQIATKRAEIVYNTEWSHKGWKDSFKGTDCSYQGENLAKDFKTAKKTHKALMNSPTHKKNIVSDTYTHVGIGTYKNITVQLFCGRNKEHTKKQ
jgi:uncharacterized protein YkwD